MHSAKVKIMYKYPLQKENISYCNIIYEYMYI
jgi:hypothetical protein